MSEYDKVRIQKLVLKGEKQKSKKRKHKNKVDSDVKTGKNSVDKDALKHGGWWKISKLSEITGPVAIQFGNRTYVKALDNGLFTLGAPHDDGEGPAPEEILTAFIINDKKVAFKSGYEKYLRIEKNGVVTGRSDAIGIMEQWEPIFQDGKMALLGDNGCFMSINPEDDSCVALSNKVGENEHAILRSCAVQTTLVKNDESTEEKGNLSQVEINYVKKYQKFQNKKLRVNEQDVNNLKKAKQEGTLHEELLERRSKMKADRYCK